MYIPDYAWSQLAVQIDGVYDEIDCAWRRGVCQFSQGCDRVKVKDLPLSIKLIDSDNKTFVLEANIKDLLIDGSNFG